MKTQLFFGKPTSLDYEFILDMFSGTKINSNRTSSVPLVQYWKNTDEKLNKLFSEVDKDGEYLLKQADDVTLCFEYPTKPMKGRGKSSMTDLMITSGNKKFAIEAKFTEYAQSRTSQKIDIWRKSGDNKQNREEVLEYWSSLIRNFSYGLLLDHIGKIDYQFYHRTASACFGTQQAFVIYQIFYDKNTEKHMHDYIKELEGYIQLINPNENLRFYVWTIETFEQSINSKEENPFILMKNTDVYKFGEENFSLLKSTRNSSQ